LKYYKHILDEINETKRLDEKNGIKRFTLLPQCPPKIRFITFDKRSLSPLYKKLCELYKMKPNTTEYFEKHFEKEFLDVMFTIRNKYKKLYEKFKRISSIATDGYSIAIKFEKADIKTPKKKKKKEKQERFDFEADY